MGADEAHRLPIRVITEMAWHALFARNMFLPVADREAVPRHVPGSRSSAHLASTPAPRWTGRGARSSS